MQYLSKSISEFIDAPRQITGFTLVEILISVACVLIFMTLAIPRYQSYQERLKLTQVKTDIRELEHRIERYSITTGTVRYPDSLADIGANNLLDPWGNAYQYFNVADAGAHPNGARKDRNLHPINSDYDLYSMGSDGRSVLPLTARPSQDDIIRANNGAFIDYASKY